MAIYFKGIFVVKGIQGEYCPDDCLFSPERGWIYCPEDNTIFKMSSFGRRPIQWSIRKLNNQVILTSIDNNEEIIINNSWATYSDKGGGRVEDFYVGNKDIFEILDTFTMSNT